MAIQVTVYLVVLAIRDSALKVLVVKRDGKAFKNRMGILGVALRGDESFEEAARRGLSDHIGLEGAYLEQLYCSVDGKAHGSGRAFSVAYYALLPADQAHRMSAAGWRSVRNLAPLSPVHQRIVEQAVKRLRKKVEHNAAGFRLLSRKFTFPELQGMYESILGRKLDKRNFRKKMSSLELLRPLPEWRRTGRKPARLYSVAARRLEKLEQAETAPPA